MYLYLTASRPWALRRCYNGGQSFIQQTVCVRPSTTCILKEAITIPHPASQQFSTRRLLKDIFRGHGGTLLLRRYWRKLGWTSLLRQAIVWFQIFHSFRKFSNRFFNGQLICYLNEFHLFPDAQSAYRRRHSTETAVLKVFSNVVGAIAKGKITLLSLLALTAAFDTVDHNNLLRRLEITYGFNGAVLQWLRSYVEDRMQLSTWTAAYRVLVVLSVECHKGPLLFFCYLLSTRRHRHHRAVI